jgi:hypothetical protein
MILPIKPNSSNVNNSYILSTSLSSTPATTTIATSDADMNKIPPMYMPGVSSESLNNNGFSVKSILNSSTNAFNNSQIPHQTYLSNPHAESDIHRCLNTQNWKSNEMLLTPATNPNTINENNANLANNYPSSFYYENNLLSMNQLTSAAAMPVAEQPSLNSYNPMDFYPKNCKSLRKFYFSILSFLFG